VISCEELAPALLALVRASDRVSWLGGRVRTRGPCLANQHLPHLPSSGACLFRTLRRTILQGTRTAFTHAQQAMVTVRNPATRLGSELYEAMQEVLDVLFNTKDSE